MVSRPSGAGQTHHESSATKWGVIDGDDAPVGPNDLGRNGKAEARAACISASSLIKAHEALEN